MSGGIPQKDLEIGSLITKELKSVNAIHWQLFLGLEQIESCVTNALRIRFGQEITHFGVVREYSAFIYGLIYHVNLEDVDWVDFERKLTNFIWVRNGSDF